MKTLTTFDLYSLVILAAIFSYILGIVIRGIIGEQQDKTLRNRITENHQSYLREAAHLRKDLLNEMEVRKLTEKLNTRLRREIEALQAHMPSPATLRIINNKTDLDTFTSTDVKIETLSTERKFGI